MKEFRESVEQSAEDSEMDPAPHESYATGAGVVEGPIEPTESVDEVGSGESGYRSRPLTEFHAEYPGEYIEPKVGPTECPPFGDPKEIARAANPKREVELDSEFSALDDPVHDAAQPYTVNCADCARAVEQRWRGQWETAAGLQNPDGSRAMGENPDRLNRWAGEPHTTVTDMEVIHQRLQEAGPGASVIVAAWGYDVAGHQPTGHAFNAVNYQGEIRVIDGQLGQDYAWRSDVGHPGFSAVNQAAVHGWDAKGRELWPR